jgi:hypothetical protein
MSFELPPIVTIGPLEPALLVSVLITLPLGWLLGAGLGGLTSHVKDPWRRVVYLGPVWVGAGLLLYVLANVVLVLVYPVLHPEDSQAIVCTFLVWPAFLLPPLGGYAAAIIRLRRHVAAPAGVTTE